MGKKKAEEAETGTSIVISGPEDKVERIVRVLRDGGVPIINDPPDIQCHPAPEAPENIKVAAVIVDSRNWKDGD